MSDVSLASITTLGIGGPAPALYDVLDLQSFRHVALQFSVDGVTPFTLGHGSNVVASDSGCTSPILRLQTVGISVLREGAGHVRVRVEAGHALWDFVEHAVSKQWAGVETLAGIPGTVGATPIQNVGAYGEEVADTVRTVTVWDWQQNRKQILTRSQCRFRHRDSIFKHSQRWTVLSVEFGLRRSTTSMPVGHKQLADALGISMGARVPLRAAMDAVLDIRRHKGMVLDPADPESRTAGSVFLSPQLTPEQSACVKHAGGTVHRYRDGTSRVSASWLIRSCGYVLGEPMTEGVRLSRRQYTLVTERGASSASFIEATERIQERVLALTGIRLRPELDLVGDDLRYRDLDDISAPAG